MNISSCRLVERAAEILGNDLARIQKTGAWIANHLVEDSGKLAKQARYKLRNGASSLAELDNRMTTGMQARPLAYLLVTLGLAAVIGLKIFLDRQNRSGTDE